MNDFNITNNKGHGIAAHPAMETCDCEGQCGCGAEERNRQRERDFTVSFLDGIVENVPNMIFLKRASDLRFEFFNQAGEALLGMDRSKLLGKNDYDFFPKDQADFFVARDREVLQQHNVVDIPEEYIETPHGTRVLHTQKIALRDVNGEPLYLLGISEDITERVQAEKTVQTQANIIDQIHDSVVSTDLEGYVTSWNKGAEQLFGHMSFEMLGKHISVVYDQDDHEFLRTGIIEPLQRLGTHEVEVKMLHKSGESFYAHLRLSMQYDDDGTPIGMIGYSMDITERKLMEQELEGYRDVLEEEVARRTEELVMARDEAERANTAKSEFLSHMSHELRTPMNAILGFGQMLKLDSEGFSELQKSNIDEILEAGEHLMGLINEVLDLAKIESGKMDVIMETVYIDNLIKQCLPMVSRGFKEHGISVTDNISGRGYTLHADQGRLKQVMLNLLSNAVKYNRENGSITLDAIELGDRRMRISVTDTGKGLTKDKIDDLFLPFDRLQNGSTIEGTGIGLVITKHLVELMGGSMGVDSVLDKGSTFWVELNCFSGSDSSDRQ